MLFCCVYKRAELCEARPQLTRCWLWISSEIPMSMDRHRRPEHCTSTWPKLRCIPNSIFRIHFLFHFSRWSGFDANTFKYDIRRKSQRGTVGIAEINKTFIFVSVTLNWKPHNWSISFSCRRSCDNKTYVFRIISFSSIPHSELLFVRLRMRSSGWKRHPCGWFSLYNWTLSKQK